MRQTGRTATAAREVAAVTSASAKRPRSPSPPPSPDSILEADFDISSFRSNRAKEPEAEDEDTETLAQRMAKRAKTSTSDELPTSTSSVPEMITIGLDPSPRRSPRLSPQHEPITHFPLASVGMCTFTANLAGFAGEEGQQEEPLRATFNRPPLSTTPPREGSSARISTIEPTPPREISPARASTDEPTRAEEEPASKGAGSSIQATSGVGEGTTPPPLVTDPSLVDQMDVDATIEETAKDAAAEAAKVAADEAAKDAHEVVAKGYAGEATKEAANPPTPSRYLKIGDDLFVGIPGMASTRAPAEQAVFDEEVIAAAWLTVVDEPSASDSSSKEYQLLQAMSSNFQKL
nr:uncharacterized protein LOC109758471 [Aegilops tauschii subsp. strangulata]